MLSIELTYIQASIIATITGFLTTFTWAVRPIIKQHINGAIRVLKSLNPFK